jgi:hypothetical protein
MVFNLVSQQNGSGLKFKKCKKIIYIGLLKILFIKKMMNINVTKSMRFGIETELKLCRLLKWVGGAHVQL